VLGAGRIRVRGDANALVSSYELIAELAPALEALQG
jgi:hypothetical protein